MKRLAPVFAVAMFASAAGAIAGCADGTTDASPAEADLANLAGADAGTQPQSNTTKVPPPAETPDDKDAGSAPSNADGGTPDSGTPDSGTTVSCNAPNTCTGATKLGNVSGDTGSDVQTASGTTSEWFTVRVTEDDTGLFATRLALTATLTSPPGSNFDLFFYVPSTDTVECSAVSQQSAKTSGPDTASVQFGETGAFFDNVDDSRTVTVEVRHVSGNCDPAQKWTLTLNGNQ